MWKDMTPFKKAISSIYKIKIKIKAKLTIEFCQGVVYCSEYINLQNSFY